MIHGQQTYIWIDVSHTDPRRPYHSHLHIPPTVLCTQSWSHSLRIWFMSWGTKSVMRNTFNASFTTLQNPFPGKSPDHSVHTYWWPNQPCCVLCIPLWLAAAWCSTKSWSQSWDWQEYNGMPSYWCSTNGHLWCQPLVSAFGFLILYIYVFAEIHALRGRVNQGSWQEYKEKMYSALPLLFS